MLMMSPTASTSDSRNWTIVSPSVCAAGMCHSTTPSPLKKFSLKLAPSYASLGIAADGMEDPLGRCDVAFSCAMIHASCAARPIWLRPAAASTALPPMCSESKLVLMIPTIGFGAGGPAVVGRNVELFHHEQPSTTPTQDCCGMRIDVT